MAEENQIAQHIKYSTTEKVINEVYDRLTNMFDVIVS